MTMMEARLVHSKHRRSASSGKTAAPAAASALEGGDIPQAVGGSMTDEATTIWRPTADMRLRTQ